MAYQNGSFPIKIVSMSLPQWGTGDAPDNQREPEMIVGF
jgi:hypothetical protein